MAASSQENQWSRCVPSGSLLLAALTVMPKDLASLSVEVSNGLWIDHRLAVEL